MDDKKTDEQKVAAVMAKYKDMEVAITVSVKTLIDVSAASAVGLSTLGASNPVQPGVVEFLEGVEGILEQLIEAEETGQEIVTL